MAPKDFERSLASASKMKAGHSEISLRLALELPTQIWVQTFEMKTESLPPL
jgi:hypothetical protein